MILVKSVHLQHTPWHTRLTFLMFPDQISIKRQNKGNQQESYRSWQSSEVCCGYVDPTQYICTSLSISSHQLLRAKRFEQEERNRARKKNVFHNLPIILQDVCPYLGFRKSWNSFRWDTSWWHHHAASSLSAVLFLISCCWLSAAARWQAALWSCRSALIHVHWLIWITENKIRTVTAALKRL